ncbi:hypothetical protein [Pseudalkalibacillus sp. JSM 102089]|uniref:hypothetical protein n=1 Tax=Pseudalkalibacillus sp. JSM 102089 TaxID=3229856 RepID=UPI00352366ED
MVQKEVQDLLNRLILIEHISTTLYLAISAYMDQKNITNSYRQAYNYIKKIDPQTTVIVQEFLREQIDEEAQTLTIVERLKLADDNTSALLLFNQELAQRQAG